MGRIKQFCFSNSKISKSWKCILSASSCKRKKLVAHIKNNRLEEIIRSRNGIIIDTLNLVDIVEIVKCGSVDIEVYEGFFCYNMQFNPYVVFVNDMIAQRDLFKKQGKDLLQGLSEKIIDSVYAGNIRGDVKDQFKCVTENWMRGNYDDGLKEWWPVKNGNSINKLEEDAGVNDQDIAKSNNQMLCQLGSFILAQSKRLKNNVIREISSFFETKFHHGVRNSAYIQKKTLVYFS